MSNAIPTLEINTEESVQIDSNYYSVAICVGNDMLEYKIIKALEHTVEKFYTIESLEELAVLSKNISVHAAYIELGNDCGSIDIIKNDISDKTHIIAITQNENERLDLLKVGVTETVIKPFFTAEIRNSFERVKGKSDHLKSAKDLRLVNSMIDFFDTETLAFHMESIAKLACAHFKISAQECANIRKCTRYLSVAVEKKPFRKALKFLEDSEDVAMLFEIASGNSAENISSAIVLAILDTERKIKGFEPYMYDNSIRSDVEKFITALYLENTYLVDTLEEVLFALERIESFAEDMSLTSRSLFLEKVKALLFHEVAYHKGAKVTFDKVNMEYVLKIEPQDKKITKRCVKLSGLDTEQNLASNITFHKEQKHFIFNISNMIFKEENTTLEITPAPETTVPAPSKQSEHITISAYEYITNNALNHDEMEVLIGLEYEMLDICDVVEDANNKNTYIKTLCSLIFKYAALINYHHEFMSMTSALYALEGTLRDQIAGEIEDKKAKMMILIIKSIVSTLIKWRKSIFVEQSTNDIHHLDANIIADCNQLMMSFFADSCAYIGDVDNDLELF